MEHDEPGVDLLVQMERDHIDLAHHGLEDETVDGRTLDKDGREGERGDKGFFGQTAEVSAAATSPSLDANGEVDESREGDDAEAGNGQDHHSQSNDGASVQEHG